MKWISMLAVMLAAGYFSATVEAQPRFVVSSTVQNLVEDEDKDKKDDESAFVCEDEDQDKKDDETVVVEETDEDETDKKDDGSLIEDEDSDKKDDESALEDDDNEKKDDE